MTEIAIKAWNLMGGELNPAWLPVVCEMLGVRDPAVLVRRLAQIRDHFRSERD